jgi:putative spermidine/putrescine transport system permease protein
VASGALFAFVTSFDEVVVALFLGGPEFRTLPRQIWSGVRESITPTVTAAAVLLVLLSLLAMAAVELLRRHAERTRMAGAGGAP